jgi:uncharacterized membrane protein YczE
VKKVRTHGILIDRKPLKSSVLIEGKLDDISHRLENSPRKSLQQIAQQSGVSVGSASKAANCCIFVCVKLLLFLKLNLWIMKKEWGFVIGLSVMCITDLLILS